MDSTPPSDPSKCDLWIKIRMCVSVESSSRVCRCQRVHACAPEGQVLQFCPDFLSVEPDGVLLGHALCGIETGSNQTHNVAIKKPSQELTKDLRTV